MNKQSLYDFHKTFPPLAADLHSSGLSCSILSRLIVTSPIIAASGLPTSERELDIMINTLITGC
jgi:hypothetical protein